jgi:hypothetical protein
MKLAVFIFISGILVLSIQICAYTEDSSLDVLVFGPSQQEAVEEDIDIETEDSQAPLESQIIDDFITGTRIADAAVSKAVTIDGKWRIEHVDSSMNVGFTLVRVDKSGKEVTVYDVDSSVRALGVTFPAGTYKVYPYSAGGPEMGEVSINILCGSAEKE